MNEQQHAETLANYLRRNGYLFHHSPNETYTKSWKQKRNNTLAGVSSGFPDYAIVLKRGSLLFLELKKEKGPQGGMNGSVISPNQERWVEALGSIDNVGAFFAHGWEDAVKIIESIERGTPTHTVSP